jgi:predicted HicB family RNase H-like nuclease
MKILKSKRGRPPLRAEVRRGRAVTTRITEAQYAKLMKAAQEAGVSLSAYLGKLLEAK